MAFSSSVLAAYPVLKHGLDVQATACLTRVAGELGTEIDIAYARIRALSTSYLCSAVQPCIILHGPARLLAQA